jgi:hypothetical protein
MQFQNKPITKHHSIREPISMFSMLFIFVFLLIGGFSTVFYITLTSEISSRSYKNVNTINDFYEQDKNKFSKLGNMIKGSFKDKIITNNEYNNIVRYFNQAKIQLEKDKLSDDSWN